MISIVESLILPEYYWYVIYILVPGYLTGLGIAKWKGGSVKVWFELDSFDKLIISIFFGGVYLVVFDFFNRLASWIFNIKLSLGIVTLFILSTGAAIVFLVVVFAIYSKMTLNAAQGLEKTTDRATQEMVRIIREAIDENKPD